MKENILGGCLVAGVIAASFRVAGRTAEDARTAILDCFDKPHLSDTALLTVGQLYALTDWESNANLTGPLGPERKP